VATTTTEQGRVLLDKLNNEQARVEVKSETPIVVIFDETPNDEPGIKAGR
jgi:hypothetical protein